MYKTKQSLGLVEVGIVVASGLEGFKMDLKVTVKRLWQFYQGVNGV
jgi:hypothetical protein